VTKVQRPGRPDAGQDPLHARATSSICR